MLATALLSFTMPEAATDPVSNPWLQDLFIAGQINRGGEGFEADLLDLGADLKVPDFPSSAALLAPPAPQGLPKVK